MFGLDKVALNVVFFCVMLAIHAIFSRSVSIKAINKEFVCKVALAVSAAASALAILSVAFYLIAGTGITSFIYAILIAHPEMAQPLSTMLLIIVAALYYTVQFGGDYLWQYVVYSAAIFVGGAAFVLNSLILVMFVAYEVVLVPTTVMIDHFSKTSRSREATLFMLYWTQIGAVGLFMILLAVFSIKVSIFEATLAIPGSRLLINVVALSAFFGFAPKIPVWPFYWWLPEAHVEVPTSFSIVLSGVSIKFAFIGYVRFVELLGNGDIYWICSFTAIVGVIDAAFRMDTEGDIKKIVAYQTVVEMHALVAYTSLDPDAFVDFVLFAMTAHCWISTCGFIVVDIISRRLHTRNIEKLYGAVGSAPVISQVVFVTVFIFASVPGTLVFSLEFYVQILSTTSAFNYALFAFMQLFVVVWSKNIWWIMWGGDRIKHELVFDLTRRELSFVAILIIQSMPSMLFTTPLL